MRLYLRKVALWERLKKLVLLGRQKLLGRNLKKLYIVLLGRQKLLGRNLKKLYIVLLGRQKLLGRKFKETIYSTFGRQKLLGRNLQKNSLGEIIIILGQKLLGRITPENKIPWREIINLYAKLVA